jgi:hypothetical protein
MKSKIYLLLAVSTVLINFSCSKDEVEIPSIGTPVTQNPTAEVNAIKKEYEGQFIPSGNYIANGAAQIGTDKENNKILRLDSKFKTSYPTNTVTLYFSTTANLSSDYAETYSKISLINKDGMQDFKLSGYDEKMKFVIIWCDRFNVLFGSAELKKL